MYLSEISKRVKTKTKQNCTWTGIQIRYFLLPGGISCSHRSYALSFQTWKKNQKILRHILSHKIHFLLMLFNDGFKVKTHGTPHGNLREVVLEMLTATCLVLTIFHVGHFHIHYLFLVFVLMGMPCQSTWGTTVESRWRMRFQEGDFGYHTERCN